MTKPELMRLVAHMDRLWLGAKLADTMLADPEVLESWFEILGRVEVRDAREVVNSFDERFAPPPTLIAKRAEEIAAGRLSRLADPEILRLPTPAERAETSAALPQLRAAIDALSRRKDPKLL